MFRCCLGLGLLLTAPLPLCAQPAARPHVDWEGNPLPAEAVARFGSTRFRMKGFVVGLALSPDEKTLACLAMDNSLNFIEAATGKLQGRFSVETDEDGFLFAHVLHFQPDGKAVGLFAGGTYRVMDVQTGKDLRKPLKLQKKMVFHRGGEASKDRKRLALADEDRQGSFSKLPVVRGLVVDN